ncbi:hypothetical protein DFH29DRAFT_1069178 [Suillus ampliporus]|nr:hypothetical protein DFH29DRAFT_1069178 [Suillus ampliporus]
MSAFTYRRYSLCQVVGSLFFSSNVRIKSYRQEEAMFVVAIMVYGVSESFIQTPFKCQERERFRKFYSVCAAYLTIILLLTERPSLKRWKIKRQYRELVILSQCHTVSLAISAGVLEATLWNDTPGNQDRKCLTSHQPSRPLHTDDKKRKKRTASTQHGKSTRETLKGSTLKETVRPGADITAVLTDASRNGTLEYQGTQRFSLSNFCALQPREEAAVVDFPEGFSDAP